VVAVGTGQIGAARRKKTMQSQQNEREATVARRKRLEKWLWWLAYLITSLLGLGCLALGLFARGSGLFWFWFALGLIGMSLLLPLLGGICGSWRRSLMNRLMSYSRPGGRGGVKGGTAEGPYFHVQAARPLGVAFLVFGVVGLCATWIFATEWLPRIVLTALCVGSLIVGLPAAVGGGCYRSRFDNGRVYWEYPSWFYGKDDSCPVEDVVEFQQISRSGDSDSSPTYRLLLKGGATKPIMQYCFGDCALFFRALQEENPTIVFTKKCE
jgi:hypothetical protein